MRIIQGLAAALAASAAIGVLAQVGAMVVTKVTATVESIDQNTREVTLKDTQTGAKVSFVAGPEVRNLAQVSKGDIVTIAYGEAIAVKLEKTDSKVRERTVTQSGERAKPGEKPGAIAVREVKVVASVEKIEKDHVTLRGPEHTETIKVNNPDVLKKVKVGDFVTAVYTEAVAISVDKAPAPAAAPSAPPKK
jgi:Cu/Ag efflux protein CusF